MSQELIAVDIALLKRLEPMTSLAMEQLEYLSTQATIEKLAPGTHLFHQGIADRKMFYLLRGDVELSSDKNEERQIVTAVQNDSTTSVQPLAKDQPRRVTATAVTEVEVVCLDGELVETMMAWGQFASHEPAVIMSEEGVIYVDKGHWLQKMYRSPIFRNLPPANIEQLLDLLDPIRVKSGDLIIRQGERGDYFYMIDEGIALVTRVVDDENESVELAEINMGSSFGEAALISDKPRNASVSMITDGVLLRLSKNDFVRLLKEPALQWVTHSELQTKLKKGAQVLDVRMSSEFAHGHLLGALNIPIQELHRRVRELDREQHYVCCCESGRRGSAAAFILGQYGVQASVLKGGLDNLPDQNLLVAG